MDNKVRITMYMTMSASGMIADEKGGTPWSQDVWNAYYSLAKKFKAIIIGRKTHDLMQNEDEFAKIGNPFVIVLSRKAKQSTENVVFVKTPKEALQEAAAHGIKDVLLAGGTQTNSAFLAQNCIHKIILDIDPIILGKGIPLFDVKSICRPLKLLGVEKMNEVVRLTYAVKERAECIHESVKALFES